MKALKSNNGNMRENRINTEFSATGKGYRGLLSLGLSAVLFLSAFLTVIPLTEITAYADRGSKTIRINGVSKTFLY